MADVQRVDWTAERYHQDDRLSRSQLVDFEDNTGVYFAVSVAKTQPRPLPSAAMELGTLFHLAVLEPGEWQEQRAATEEHAKIPPPYAGEGAKKRREDWRANLHPLDVEVTEAQRDALIARHKLVDLMAGSLFVPRTPAARAARNILDSSEREVTYLWRDMDPDLACGPIDCRARLDLVNVTPKAARIVDLKSCADPTPRAFARAIGDRLYHWQAPFYSAPVFEQTGLRPDFAFIAVRSAPPFDVAVYQLRREHIDAADVQVRRAMRRLSVCRQTNNWLSPWEKGGQYIDVPRWALEVAA